MFILFLSLPSWMRRWIPVILGSGTVYAWCWRMNAVSVQTGRKSMVRCVKCLGPGCPLYKRTPSDSRRRGRRAANPTQTPDVRIASLSFIAVPQRPCLNSIKKKKSQWNQHNVVCHNFGELLMLMDNSLHCYDAHDERNTNGHCVLLCLDFSVG